MLARILRILTVAWVVALAAAVVHAAVHGWKTGSLVAAALLLFVHPAWLLAEGLLMRTVSRAAGRPIPLTRLLRSWAGECIASSVTFAWRMPWREHAQPDSVTAAVQGRRGVVLVHGYVCNRALWNPLMARLRAAGHPFIAPTLEPVFGGIEGGIAPLDDAIGRLRAATGRAPIVVAHSMGGLVVRAWLRQRAAGDATAEVAAVVTIGTPHRGTWLARFGVSDNARQMRLDGDWLTALASAMSTESAACFTCWWSECDQVVYPPPTAQLPGARACRIEGVAHLALSQRPEIADDLLRRLDA